MKIFDLHQDLMLHMLSREQYGQHEQTSWKMLEDSAVDLVVATAFPDPVSGDQFDPVVNDLITADIKRYSEYIQRASDRWCMVEQRADLIDPRQKLLLHIEGFNAFNGNPTDWQQLEAWYEAGLRSVAPWWNIDNALGGGTNSPNVQLTSLGAELVAWVEKSSVVLDLAHAGRQAFADVARLTARPLYISHGNADTLCPSPRNYTDVQLRQIAETDGVIGVFFPSTFTVGKGQMGTIADAVRHFFYIRDLIGVRHLAIGSDFGGIITGTLDGLSSVSDFPALLTTLSEAGFSTDDISAIAHKNANRVLKAHLS